MAAVPLNNDEIECSPAKKNKLETKSSSENASDIHENEISLASFEIKRVLQNNCLRKQVCVEGAFKEYKGTTVILLEKQNFATDEESLKRDIFNKDTVLRKLYSNNIYGNYECFPTKDHNGINAMIMHPATSKHVEKFIRKELYMIDETYELYQKITLPHIESSSFSLEWVYNILEHKAEQDKIIYEDQNNDTGFVLVNDIRWDGQSDTLKLIALSVKKIRSIRELNATHLPLLKNIRDAGTREIIKKFNIPPSQLRIYLHYQPSYYHLHVHFAYLMFETPGIFVEKAHLLSMVIRNIELMSDYYTKAVLSYVVAAGDPLCIKFQEEGILTDVKSESTESSK